MDNSTPLQKSKKQRIPNTKPWNWFINRIWSGIEHHQQSYLEWNQNFTSKNNTLKNNNKASDSTRLNPNKLWKKTTLLPDSHSNNGTNKLLNKPFKQTFQITDIKHDIIGIPIITKNIPMNSIFNSRIHKE